MAGVVLIVMVFAAMIITGLMRRLSNWNRTYEKLGERYLGKKPSKKGGIVYAFLMNKPSLRFDYGRTFCSVRNRKSVRFSSRRQTEISMLWPNRKFKLEVSTSKVLSPSKIPTPSRVWTKKSMKPIELDDDSFAGNMHVVSNNPDMANQILSRNVQWQIEQLKRLGAGQEISVELNRGSLVISKPGYIKAYQPLEDFVRLSLELFDQMMLVNAEGLEFVNEDMATVVDDVKCPICSEEIKFDLVVCTRCKTPHCRDCWQYNGQCATFACSEKRFLSIGSASTNQG